MREKDMTRPARSLEFGIVARAAPTRKLPNVGVVS